VKLTILEHIYVGVLGTLLYLEFHMRHLVAMIKRTNIPANAFDGITYSDFRRLAKYIILTTR
jgi:hypothetical protein